MLPVTELDRFVRDGYCTAHTKLNPELVERAIDRTWQLAPETFQRNQPRTWKGEFTDSCSTATIEKRRGRVKWRKCLRKERWIYDLLVRDPVIQQGIAQLIGIPLPPSHVRGLYPIFPSSLGKRRDLHGHMDRHLFQVGTILYLSDVEPGGGAFTLWPGSHLEMEKQYRQIGGDERTATHSDVIDRLHRTIQAVEVSGKTGTVVFWHHRLLHAAGINRSRSVRQALLGDFRNQAFTDSAHEAPSDPWKYWEVQDKGRVKQNTVCFASEDSSLRLP